VTFLSRFSFFSVSSAISQVAVFVRIARLMAQKSFPIDARAFWGFGAFKFTMRGLGPKNRQILTHKSADFLQKIALILKPLRVNYP